jgi:hypothetical protein
MSSRQSIDDGEADYLRDRGPVVRSSPAEGLGHLGADAHAEGHGLRLESC